MQPVQPSQCSTATYRLARAPACFISGRGGARPYRRLEGRRCAAARPPLRLLATPMGGPPRMPQHTHRPPPATNEDDRLVAQSSSHRHYSASISAHRSRRRCLSALHEDHPHSASDEACQRCLTSLPSNAPFGPPRAMDLSTSSRPACTLEELARQPLILLRPAAWSWPCRRVRIRLPPRPCILHIELRQLAATCLCIATATSHHLRRSRDQLASPPMFEHPSSLEAAPHSAFADAAQSRFRRTSPEHRDTIAAICTQLRRSSASRQPPGMPRTYRVPSPPPWPQSKRTGWTSQPSCSRRTQPLSSLTPLTRARRLPPSLIALWRQCPRRGLPPTGDERPVGTLHYRRLQAPAWSHVRAATRFSDACVNSHRKHHDHVSPDVGHYHAFTTCSADRPVSGAIGAAAGRVDPDDAAVLVKEKRVGFGSDPTRPTVGPMPEEDVPCPVPHLHAPSALCPRL